MKGKIDKCKTTKITEIQLRTMTETRPSPCSQLDWRQLKTISATSHPTTSPDWSYQTTRTNLISTYWNQPQISPLSCSKRENTIFDVRNIRSLVKIMFCSSNDRKLIDVKCGNDLTLKPQLAYSRFLEILRLRHRSQII